MQHLINHHRAVERNPHSQVVILCLHFEPPHLHQVPVQLSGSEEEFPLEIRVAPVVQQHQQAALCALPLQPGETICAAKARPLPRLIFTGERSYSTEH